MLPRTLSSQGIRKKVLEKNSQIKIKVEVRLSKQKIRTNELNLWLSIKEKKEIASFVMSALESRKDRNCLQESDLRFETPWMKQQAKLG